MKPKEWLHVKWPPWAEIEAERDRSRQNLINSCVEASEFIQAEQHQDQFKASEKDNIRNAVQFIKAWLDESQDASKDDFEAQQELLEDVVTVAQLRFDGLTVEIPSDTD